MDHFREEVVVKHNRTLDEVMYILSWVVIVFSGIVAFINLQGFLLSFGVQMDLAALVQAVIFGAVAIVTFIYNGRFRTEYEYTFTNGDLDFAQVFNNKKRKSLGSLKVRSIEAFGPVPSGAFNRYINMPNVKQMRWFLNRGANLYFFYWQKNGDKRVLICEPSEEMVKDIRAYLGNGVYQEH